MINKIVLTDAEKASYDAFCKDKQALIKQAEASGDKDALWHARRMLGLGGSEIGSIMGINEYATPYSFWEVKTGRKPAFQGNNATYWGSVLEQVVADEYCKRTGNKVRKESKHYNASKFGAPFLVGNIDRLILANDKADTKILECKTARDDSGKDADGNYIWGQGNRYCADGSIIALDDTVPSSYYLQVQHYMLLLDKAEADLAVFFLNSRTFSIFTIKRDDDICNAILQAGKDFMFNNIIGDQAPEMTAADYDNLGLAVSGEAITATNDILTKVNDLRDLKAEIKSLEAKEKALEDELKEFTGEHSQLADINGKLIATYKAITRTTLNTKDLKEQEPDVYARYCDSKVYARSFTLKK